MCDPRGTASSGRSNNNVVYRCTYHVVWCPKYQRKVIEGAVDDRLQQIIRDVCAERDARIIELETMPDHVHLLVSRDPQYGIHRLVKQIKARSSRYIRQEFPAVRSRIPTLWTNSYFVATLGGAPLEIVKQCLANQRNA
ncbi:IS200/IS605 family transposase [Pseudonocardia sp. DSM 110487]|uniref:IS200/IS605 family transposase n=1 Tax=Pseudonocardia sp. DSM 110487 TaxID=2865833 RepID=UPI001C6969E3|nr:IS200/IS605 family transposase [Pseudonocardia sp. DSM 110487]QYN33771.1 IS200/IS605 family transposase [Pseudonocardia sp. DSM 110487]